MNEWMNEREWIENCVKQRMLCIISPNYHTRPPSEINVSQKFWVFQQHSCNSAFVDWLCNVMSFLVCSERTRALLPFSAWSACSRLLRSGLRLLALQSFKQLFSARVSSRLTEKIDNTSADIYNENCVKALNCQTLNVKSVNICNSDKFWLLQKKVSLI